MNNRELRTLFFNCTGETSSTNSGRFRAFCDGVSSQQSELDKATARIAQLEDALYDASVSIADWGAYASTYFQAKWGLAQDIQKYLDIANNKPIDKNEQPNL